MKKMTESWIGIQDDNLLTLLHFTWSKDLKNCHQGIECPKPHKVLGGKENMLSKKWHGKKE